jgi:hypothetical protein
MHVKLYSVWYLFLPSGRIDLCQKRLPRQLHLCCLDPCSHLRGKLIQSSSARVEDKSS